MIMGSLEDISQQVFTILPKMPKGSLSGNALRALWKEISQLLQVPHLILLSPNRPRFFHGSTCNNGHQYHHHYLIISTIPIIIIMSYIHHHQHHYISCTLVMPYCYVLNVLLTRVSCFEYSLRQRQVVSAMGPCSELADQKDCDSDDLWIINATSRFKIYLKDCGSDEFRIMAKGWKGLPWIAV